MATRGILGDSLTLKKFYLAVILIAFALAVGSYVFFATEKPVYVAKGKFSYYLNTSASNSNAPFISDAFTKSIADSIQTRSFLEKLYNTSSVKFTHWQSDKPNDYIKSSVVSGSNVIEVKLFSTDRDSLYKLSQKFFSVLDSSPVIVGTSPRPNINIVDAVYTDQKPSYPKPFEYAGLVFIGSLLVGIMFLYIFSNNES